ncbi:hypothetical protein CSIM01_12611 [Colletotrichum simmondsii]|uniref:Uncharacterized protein n=1 Tax=Colletotrichum simmondsii TaxID=703756 RepID=A0A135RTK0_9PEZI|nr:hypothetical protein CSIM01_12611 [Colletotrichum simmondsii]
MESPEIPSAILGWDWGSTAIRVSLLVFQGSERIIQEVFNTESHPGHDERYQKGAFNSALYLDGKGDVYPGERMDDNRISTPSKELFSMNSTANNSFKAINKNLNGVKSSGSREFIFKGMEAIARGVLQQVQSHCNGGYLYGRMLSGVKIRRVGLSYPAFWRQEERTFYERIIRGVMPEFADVFTNDTDVDFHVENLASAHNLFWNQRLHNKILQISDKPTLLVFLDFGGYTLNGCMFTVIQGTKEVFSYYRVGDTFCTSGGTQLWERAFADFAARYFETQQGIYLPPRERTQLLQSFHLQIKKFNSNKINDMSLHVTDPENATRSRTVYLTETQAGQCFWDGMKRPIDLAKQKIAEAATLSDRVRVVVSGGSGKSSIVQAHVHDACRKAKIDAPYPFYEKAGDKDSWNISKGAAIATATTMTGLEFIERGAAFGIQVGYIRNSDGSTVRRNESAVTNRTTFWQEKAKVTVDAVPERREELTALLSYDILELPPPTKGYWRFTQCIVYDGDTMILSLHRDYLGTNKNARTAIRSEKHFSCPMYFDNSSNCFLLDTDVDDGGRGLRLNEEGKLTCCTEDSVKEQLRSLQRSTKTDHTPRKRQRRVSKSSSRRKKRQPGRKPTGHLLPLQPPPEAVCESTLGESARIFGAELVGAVHTHDSSSDDDYEPVSHPVTPPVRLIETRSRSLRKRSEYIQSSFELETGYPLASSEDGSDDHNLDSYYYGLADSL